MTDYIYSDVQSTIKSGFNRGYSIEYDADAVRNSLLNIFTIQKGQVPGKPEFGNPINLQVFDLYNFFSREEMEDSIRNTILTYEPRIQTVKVNVLPIEEYNRIIINLSYAYNLDDDILYDSLDIPYSHNTISYLGGRISPPTPNANLPECKGQTYGRI